MIPRSGVGRTALLGILAFVAVLAILHGGKTKIAIAIAPPCNNYNSNSTVPPNLGVGLTSGGVVYDVVYPQYFIDYVKDVLPNEWWPNWHQQAYQAGAVAVRDYAWYNTNHWRSFYVAPNGKCYNVRDDQQDQVYCAGCGHPGDPHALGHAASTAAAVDTTWASARMTRGGVVFSTNHEAGWDSDGCGDLNGGTGSTNGAPIGRNISQKGSEACAAPPNNYVWTAILRKYYFYSTGEPTQVMLLDDAPAVADYNGQAYAFGLNKPGQSGLVGGVVAYRIYTRSTQSWSPLWTQPSNPPGSGPIQCTSAAATEAYESSQFWVMCRGTLGQIYAKRYDGSNWSGWMDLGGVSISAPAIARYGQTLYAFHVGTDGNVWYKTCPTATCATLGNWVGWQTIGQPSGGCTTSPTADLRSGGLLYVFCRGSTTTAGYPKAPIRYKTYSGSWSGWTTVPGGDLVSAPAATDFFDGTWHIHVHANTETGPVWANQIAGGAWYGWYQPFPPSLPCTSTPGNSNLPPANDWLFVICRGFDGSFQERHWNTTAWTGWVGLGLPP